MKIKKNNDFNNFQLMIKSKHHSLHNSGENHPMFGKHHSEKSKKSMSNKKSGENNPRSILTEQKVIKIRKYLSEKVLTQKEIGILFGVKPKVISDIKTGKCWK